METNEKKLFIVLEEHMLERYAYLIKKYEFQHYVVGGYENIQIGTTYRDILNRVKCRNVVKSEYLKLKEWVQSYYKPQGLLDIYLSNSEGYIAYNYADRLKKDFPKIKLIAIQHGVFSFSKIPKRNFRFLINKFSKIFFGFYPIGVGFGGKIVDKYIVYNDKYKKFLVDSFGWDAKDVMVDLKFIKTELYDKRTPDLKEKNTAIFLLQCLSKAGLCSIEDEAHLITKTMEHISHKYDKVFIKKHPACETEMIINLKENCFFVDDLVEGLNRSSYAYSFSSTTILEAEIFDVEGFAIDSKLLTGDKNIYNIFKNVINFEDTVDK